MLPNVRALAIAIATQSGGYVRMRSGARHSRVRRAVSVRVGKQKKEGWSARSRGADGARTATRRGEMHGVAGRVTGWAREAWNAGSNARRNVCAKWCRSHRSQLRAHSPRHRNQRARYLAINAPRRPLLSFRTTHQPTR
eukprot:11224312-Lingulodinium_polyedra.AAC.2